MSEFKWKYSTDKIILSHSTQTTAESCWRKFEFKKMYGDLERIPGIEDTGNFPADVGKALHAGYQNFLIHRDEDKAAMEFLKEFPYELEFQKSDNVTRSLEASFSTLQAMISHPSATKYQLVEIKGLDGITRPAIEVPFVIEITNAPLPVPVYYVGFIDAVLYDSFEYGYFASDIKTTRRWANDFSAKYEFDEQTVPYGMILEHCLGHEMDDLNTNYLIAYVDLLEPKVQSHWFKKSKEDLQDWLRGLCVNIDQIAEFSKYQFFPRATSGDVCFAWNSKCEFLEYCTFRDPETIAKIMGSPKQRKGFFHDGKEPWVRAQLPYLPKEVRYGNAV